MGAPHGGGIVISHWSGAHESMCGWLSLLTHVSSLDEVYVFLVEENGIYLYRPTPISSSGVREVYFTKFLASRRRALLQRWRNSHGDYGHLQPDLMILTF